MTISLLFSCNSSNTDEVNSNKNIETTKQNVDDLPDVHQKLGDSLLFPDNIFSILDKELSLAEYHKNNPNEYKVITFLPATCLACMNAEAWQNYINETKLDSKATLIFITSGEREPMIDFFIYDQAKAQFHVFYDEKNQFYTQNKLSADKRFHTFLLKNDKIILVGSPIVDDGIAKKYQEIFN
ncbi:MAG: hypothetical protein H6586_06815 [Flavobacteriales bacterium]|nr:hypothetical protein [Flavobacteriales bacterium]